MFSSISSRWRVDGCDFWIENLKLLELNLPLTSHGNFPSRQGVAMTQFVVRMWPSIGEDPSARFGLSFWPMGRGREESDAES